MAAVSSPRSSAEPTVAVASASAAASHPEPAPSAARPGEGVALHVAVLPPPPGNGAGAGPVAAEAEPSTCDVFKQYFFSTVEKIKEFARTQPLLAIILVVALVALTILLFLPSIVSAIIIGALALTAAGYVIYALWENRKEILLKYMEKALSTGPQPGAPEAIGGAAVTVVRSAAAPSAEGALANASAHVSSAAIAAAAQAPADKLPSKDAKA